jgi:hypothetical protein
MDETEIPADKSQNGVGSELADRNQEQLRSIVTGSPTGSQIGAFYASYMDEARLEQLDAAPLKADLDRVAAIKTKAEFARHMASTFSDFGSTLFAAGVLPDPANPTMNIAFVGTSGMGLPDRDYYLLDKYKPQRDAYRAYIERTFGLIGTPNAAAAADRVLAFETEIAKLSWPQAELRDLDKLNNPMSLAQLSAYAPGLDWNRYLTDVRVASSPKLIVGDNTAVKGLAALYDKTPLETLKTWQTFKVADQAGNYLSKRFVDNKFAFAKTLTGAKELRARWRRGINEVDGRLGEVLGETYVQRYFTPQSKNYDGRARRQSEEGVGGPHQGEQLDGGGYQEGRSYQAGAHGRDGGLSGEVQRLFQASDEGGRSLRQREAQLGLRVGISAERPRQAGRPQEVGNEPGDRERLQRWPGEQDRIPGGHIAAALFRSQRGRRGQLWRDRRDHRPRDHARLRRPGTQDRREWRDSRLVDEGRRRALQGANQRTRQAICRL